MVLLVVGHMVLQMVRMVMVLHGRHCLGSHDPARVKTIHKPETHHIVCMYVQYVHKTSDKNMNRIMGKQYKQCGRRKINSINLIHVSH
jgi:hypothetical protein